MVWVFGLKPDARSIIQPEPADDTTFGPAMNSCATWRSNSML
jgi:hypothetical protein